MMKKLNSSVVLTCMSFIILLPMSGFSTEAIAQPKTQQSQLLQMSQFFEKELHAHKPQLYYDLLSSQSIPQKRLNENPDIQLMYINDVGHPVYYILENLDAARTVSTDDVWPGGSGGFSLSGSGTATGKFCIWDGGGVRINHQEFTGRVTQIDGPIPTHYHATHVAGTMIAAGVSANAKGMSYSGTLAAYEWTNDNSEMAAAAASGMNVSNHSYGWITGWYFNGDWYWYGDISISTTEDYGFGFYGSDTRAWDNIAYNAPYYTIVKSAGNDRNDFGPGAGGGHWVLNGGWVWSTATRDPDGGTDGYDCVSWNGTAKNIITVGAVNDIPSGYSDTSDVVMSSFSGWGPTDDGRIKPDIVANGIGLYSCIDDNNSAYASFNGTSMSAPNLSGSLNLLIRHYEATNGNITPLSSTMKAVIIHTADEAGTNPGPDYRFGWGLLNTLKAAELIQSDSLTPGLITEAPLTNGETDNYYLYNNGAEPIRVTLVWTDPPGTSPSPSLNPTTLMLVNDLDLRLEHESSSTVYQPYVLNPGSPANAASTGDNIRDNVEHIYVSSPPAGSYHITVTHKGTLSSPQYYSIIKSSTMAVLYGSVAGTVTDNSMAPIQDVHVAAVSTTVDDSTDVWGVYNLDSLETGSYNILFSHSGYRDSTITGVNVSAGNTTPLNVIMEELPGAIAGVVTNISSGLPVSGVHVTAIGTGYDTYTDPLGEYSFTNLEVRNHTLVFSHNDYRDSMVTGITVTPGDTTTLDVAMTQLPGQISGVVTQQTSRAPIESVYVAAIGTGVDAYTNPNGEYTLDNIDAGTYEVTFSHEDYEDTSASGVTVTPGDTTILDVAMTQFPGQISGVVTQQASRAPIESVYVAAIGTGVDAYTNSNGEYTLDSIDAGTHEVTFSHEDYEDTSINNVIVTPDDTTVLSISMIELPGVITGVVTKQVSRAPIESVYVAATGTGVDTYTNSNGEYTLGNIDAGIYEITFSHDNYEDTSASGITVTPGDTTILNITMLQFSNEYLPGDVNMFVGDWPPAVQGGDVTYLVNNFRMYAANQPCYLQSFWCSADINGNCEIDGGDVTALVNVMRLILPEPMWCELYPPAWQTADDLPEIEPSGWPNCEAPSVSGSGNVIPIERGK